MISSFFDSRAYRMFVILLLIFCTLAIWYVKHVDSQDLTALHLTQCLRAECNTCSRHDNERAAIAHVIVKRQEMYNFTHKNKFRTLDDQILAYCAVFDIRSKNYYRKRAINIRKSTFENPLIGKKSWWDENRKWSESFVSNPYLIKDPEPRAWHWGSYEDMSDINTKRWEVVAMYSNWFIGLRRKGKNAE